MVPSTCSQQLWSCCSDKGGSGEADSAWPPAGASAEWPAGPTASKPGPAGSPQALPKPSAVLPQAPGCPFRARGSVACLLLSILHPVLCPLRCGQADPIPSLCMSGMSFVWTNYPKLASGLMPASLQNPRPGEILEGKLRKNSHSWLMPEISPLDIHSFNLNTESSGVLCTRGEE